MPVNTQLVRFGVFELDLISGELCKNGRKLRLQEQPFRLLHLLLEPPGQAVTRDRLKEALWPADTFVDFDHSLNAAIGKLRQALSDSAENPRFIETLARRGYRFIAPVEFAVNGTGAGVQALGTDRPIRTDAREDNRPVERDRRSERKTHLLVWITIALALLTFALWFWQRRQTGETVLVKLTDDTGLTTDPAISADGKLLAYASDRGSSGNLNIWIQQIGPGANSAQLTHDNVNADEPTFSPDGASIAFTSKKNGGGIYIMPVIGGEASRLTQSGRSPRFSPDGRWIAYWSGGNDAVVPTVGGAGAVYVIAASGGKPRRLALDLSSAAYPGWSPDGKHLLVYVRPKNGYAWDEADWWLVSVDGTPSRRAGNLIALKRQGFSLGFDRMPRLSQWTQGFIIFTAGFGDAVNAWRARVSGDGRITGSIERLTSGTTLETSPTRASSGQLIFTSLNRKFAVWSLPADPDHANVTGELKMITAGSAEVLPSISRNGRMLAFTAARRKVRADDGAIASGQTVRSDVPVTFSEEASELQVQTKDLLTGKERMISGADTAAWHPQISGDGSMVAYTSGKPGQVYAAPVSEGSSRMIVAGKNLYAWDWSPDNRYLLFDTPDARVHSVDVQSGSEKLFLRRPGFVLFQAKFSPDTGSVAVEGVLANDGTQSQIFVVPIENGAPAPPDRWLAIDHPSRWDDKPRWSPKGNLIYFISDRDGYLCLWAQRVASHGKELVGTPFPVYHFHDARLSMANVDTGILEIGVAEDKIVIGLGELTGNIWSLRRKQRS